MENEYNLLLGIAGTQIRLILAFIIQRSRFCMTAIVSNYILLRDVRQFHTYMIAIVIAISGVFFLETVGIVSIGDSAYRSPNIHLFSSIIGGLFFGIGAVMADGCNIGQGITGLSTLSVESIIVVLSIFAGMYLGVKWLQNLENHHSLWLDIRDFFYHKTHPQQ